VTEKLCLEKAANDSRHVLIPERRLKLESQILTKCLADNGADPRDLGNEDGGSDRKAHSITQRAVGIVATLLPLIPVHVFDGVGCILVAYPDRTLSHDRIGHGLVSCRQSRLNEWSAPSYFDLFTKDPNLSGHSFDPFMTFYAFQTSSAVQKERWLVGSDPLVVPANLYETLVIGRDDCFQFQKDSSSCVIAFGGLPPAELEVENLNSEINRLIYGQDFELTKIFNTSGFQAPQEARPWINALPN
jgi:hypothetical protein